MASLRRFRYSLIVVGVMMVAVTGGRLVGNGASAASAAPALQSVSARTLALSAGVTLDAPSGAPVLTRAAAEQVATAIYPGSTIREAIVADLKENWAVPAIHRLAWIVSVMPPNGVWSAASVRNHGQLRLDYLLAFVDATTGAYINSLRGQQRA